jgi:hypothetical protein
LLHVCFSIVDFPPSRLLTRSVFQDENNIGADGARAVADAMRFNSSVQELWLVRMCCR